MNSENSTEAYTPPYVKRIASGKLLYKITIAAQKVVKVKMQISELWGPGKHASSNLVTMFINIR